MVDVAYSAAAVEAELEAAIQRAPFEVRERLARRLFTPQALRAARLDERREAVLRAVLGRADGAKKLARELHDALLRYQTSAWLAGDCRRLAPKSGAHRELHRIMRLSLGQAPSVATLRAMIPAAAKNQSRFLAPGSAMVGGDQERQR